jgi:hypothetical protein
MGASRRELGPLTPPRVMTVTTPAPAMTEAEGLAYLAPRPRYTAARIEAAARVIGSRMIRLYSEGRNGWTILFPGGRWRPCQTLADVAAALLRDHAAAARARAVKAAAAAPAAPAAPAPAGPGPELPDFVTCQQQQQQPQQGGQWRNPARGGRVAWDEPGESAADVAAHNAALARKVAAPAPCSYDPRRAEFKPQTCFAKAGPLVAPGPLARSVAPARIPADVAALLSRFGLTVEGLLTVGASNGKLAKGVAKAWPVILHHLPARALAQAVAGPAPGSTAPRSRIDGLQALAQREGVFGLAMAHNGCPWASQGCAAGCLAWAGHGGMSVTVAAARARRTLAMLAGGPVYSRAILWALARAYRQAQAKGLPLAYRLRGTDDLHWHLARLTVTPAEAQALARRYGLPVVPGEGMTLTEALSLAPAGSIRPYDYSAAPVDGAFGLKAQRAAGIDTTCSLKADRPGGVDVAIQAIAADFRVAVPVALAKGQPLPLALLLRRGPDAPVWRLACIDGDASDHRWADPQGPQPGGFDGVAVILRTKRSRGKGPEADAFSLQSVMGAWQPLAGGGQAALSSTPWEG